MPTGLVALSDDGIAPLILQPSRLIHCGGRRDDLCAGRSYSVQKSPLGQAEVEADDLGRELLHKVTHGAVEGSTGRSGNRRLWIKSEFDVVALQPLLPGILSRWVSLWRLVAEEVEVDGPGSPLTDDPSSFRICSGLSIAQGREPSPPASETAITISDPTDPAMGAWMIGNSISKRS